MSADIPDYTFTVSSKNDYIYFQYGSKKRKKLIDSDEDAQPEPQQPI
jgi:hypothetical protein